MIIRSQTSFITQSLQHFPAVLLIGARQVGKSTLAKQLVDHKILSHYVTLDDLTNLNAAKSDPDDFILNQPAHVALDEVQRAPDLMRAIKKCIDDKKQMGHFLLTGSANVLAYPQVHESLAGRLDVMRLEGLSLSELYQQTQPCPLLSNLFSINNVTQLVELFKTRQENLPPLSKKAILEHIYFGGFPEIALKKDQYFTQRWFSSYQTTYIERDVHDLNKSIDIIPFAKLLRLCGMRTGNLLVKSNIANDINMDQRTVIKYLGILELTFQFNFLNPWHINSNKRLIKTPKIYCNDSGFATHLCGINSPDDLKNSPFLGALLETWVWQELRKMLTINPNIESNFYRTHQGHEVDFLLAKGNKTVGIEVKWNSNISQSDFKGLKDLQSILKENFVGVVLYPGSEIAAFGSQMLALPMQLLI